MGWKNVNTLNKSNRTYLFKYVYMFVLIVLKTDLNEIFLCWNLRLNARIVNLISIVFNRTLFFGNLFFWLFSTELAQGNNGSFWNCDGRKEILGKEGETRRKYLWEQ